jgi:hypothetical protein
MKDLSVSIQTNNGDWKEIDFDKMKNLVPQKSIKIKKAKLTSMNYLEVEYEETIEFADEAIRYEATKKCMWNAHNDLKIQFDRLKPHVALLTELITDAELSDLWETHPYLSKIKATGYVIGGDGEHEGVTVIGRKILAHNRILNLVTPFAKWQDEHTGYTYASELRNIIKDCENEVIEYLNGKHAPNSQQELQFDEPNKEQNAQVSDTTKMSKE